MILKNLLKKTIKLNRKKLSDFGILRPEDVNNAVIHKSVKVAILGAENPVGFYTSFLLKQNPFISQLNLYGTGRVLFMANDLEILDTKCRVSAFFSPETISTAIRGVDIIAIMGFDSFCYRTPWNEIFYSEAQRIIDLTEACIKYNPKAIVVVCASPVSCFLPLVSSLYRASQWYHPGRIIGSVALAEVRANSIMAKYNELEPEVVHTPLTGGPDIDCAVPLFSLAEPVEASEEQEKNLCCQFKGIPLEECPIKTDCFVKPSESYLAEAFGITRLISIIGFGLCDDQNATGKAFVRQNFMYGCRYLTSTVKFGPKGLYHNYGVPLLTNFELSFLERVIMNLDYREYIVEDYLQRQYQGKNKITCLLKN